LSNNNIENTTLSHNNLLKTEYPLDNLFEPDTIPFSDNNFFKQESPLNDLIVLDTIPFGLSVRLAGNKFHRLIKKKYSYSNKLFSNFYTCNR